MNKPQPITALEFILKEHDNLFTKDELNKNWEGIPPSIEEICSWMNRFTELHIRLQTPIVEFQA